MMWLFIIYCLLAYTIIVIWINTKTGRLVCEEADIAFIGLLFIVAPAIIPFYFIGRGIDIGLKFIGKTIRRS